MRALEHGVQVETLDAPPAIATPRVEGAMVAGRFHSIEDVAMVDMVPSTATVSYVDSRARYVVDGTVPNRDRSCDPDLNTPPLLSHLPRLVPHRTSHHPLSPLLRPTPPPRSLQPPPPHPTP